MPDHNRVTGWLVSCGGLVVAIVFWWLAVTILEVPSYYLPRPDSVAERLLSHPSLYIEHARYTLEKVVVGGLAGALSGFVLAIVVVQLPRVRHIVMPYLVIIRVLPKIAIAPVLLLYLGTGMSTAVIFVALIAFFPMVLNTVAGFARTPQGHRDLLASVDAGPLRTFLSVTVPFALPDVFAGLKQSITLAVVGAIIAEWVVADTGLGYLVLIGSENLQTDLMIAALAVLLLIGLVLYGLIVQFQHRVLRGWLVGFA